MTTMRFASRFGFYWRSSGTRSRPLAAEFLTADIQQMTRLILDHHMPHMTGLGPAARLRGDGIRLPILLISGSPTPDMIVRASQLGIERVLDKPPSEDELIEFIEASSAR